LEELRHQNATTQEPMQAVVAFSPQPRHPDLGGVITVLQNGPGGRPSQVPLASMTEPRTMSGLQEMKS
jgi:hypothetical protein